MALNLANVQTTDTFQTWFTRTNQIISSAFPTTGGTITGNLTVDGDALFSGNTTIVSKTTIETTDALLHLAANNEFSDILDIGYFAHYNDGGPGYSNNHTGIIRDSGTKEYYIFSEYKPGFEPTSDININHATFKLANTHVNKLYANNLSVEGPATISGYVNFSGTGQVNLPVGNTAQRTVNQIGSLRYNTDNGKFEGYNASGWGQIGGTPVGAFLFQNTSYTATSGDRIAVDTSSGPVTITLPASPSTDDIVEFIDRENTFNTHNLTILRNGSTIEDATEDLAADISSTNFYLQYDGSTWQVFGIATGTQYFEGILSAEAFNATTSVTANTANFTHSVSAKTASLTHSITANNASFTNSVSADTASFINSVSANTASFTSSVSADTASITDHITANSIGLTTSITANTGAFAGEVDALDFNTTSDISMKNSVATIGNASQIIESLRGVSFKWKNNDKPAYGVVAQEVEKVLPELVVDNKDGVKSVKYLGLIGFLIESNKQLMQRIETLEDKLRDN